MTVRVSVVVPTFRRPEFLDRCLAALAVQDLDPLDYEVIVADNASSLETRRQVADWNERVPAKRSTCLFRYVDAAQIPGPAAARNAGWQAGRGGVIAFTDDDCVADPSWLRSGLAALKDGLAAVSGQIVMPLSKQPTDYERNEAGLEQAVFVTANCFCRRDVLAAVGGFDERFTVAWREDSDLHFTLLERGYHVERVPEAIVVHPVRPAPWGVSIVQQKKSLYNALLYKKHPDCYWRYIQPAPPWHYYVIVLALLLVPSGLVAQVPVVALSAAGLWSLMTGRFCLQRLDGTSRAPWHIAEMAMTSALIPPLAVYWRVRGALKFRVLFL